MFGGLSLTNMQMFKHILFIVLGSIMKFDMKGLTFKETELRIQCSIMELKEYQALSMERAGA